MGLRFYLEEWRLSSFSHSRQAHTLQKDASWALQHCQATAWQGDGDLLPGRQLQGRSHAPAAMSTGGLWWAEQYLKAPRVHIWLAQRPVLGLCTHGPPAAPPAGCTVIHLRASLGITLGWVRRAYRCSFAISGPLYLPTDSARDTFSRPMPVICSDGHPTLMYLQFTVPRYLGTFLQGPSKLRG